MRKGFTLIEIIISVAIISLVVTGIMKMEEQNMFLAKKISSRMQNELSNTLFTDKKMARKYSKDEKDAYTMLDNIRPRDDKARGVLKEIKRKIFYEANIPTLKQEGAKIIDLNVLMLKHENGYRYYRLGKSN